MDSKDKAKSLVSVGSFLYYAMIVMTAVYTVYVLVSWSDWPWESRILMVGLAGYMNYRLFTKYLPEVSERIKYFREKTN